MDANTLIGIIIKHLLCRLSEKFSDSVFFGFNYSLCSVYFTLGWDARFWISFD